MQKPFALLVLLAALAACSTVPPPCTDAAGKPAVKKGTVCLSVVPGGGD
jgi:Prokaryotic membrane lipoprotein lipid attachment site